MITPALGQERKQVRVRAHLRMDVAIDDRKARRLLIDTLPSNVDVHASLVSSVSKVATGANPRFAGRSGAIPVLIGV